MQPTVTVDPEDGSFSFAFAIGQEPADIDATLERLLQLPGELARRPRRRTALIIDEFQEIVEIDAKLPRSDAGGLPAAAGGRPRLPGQQAPRHGADLQRRNEPFWRSAKSVELGPIDAAPFRALHRRPFRDDRQRKVGEGAPAELLELTGGHPYATQELSYFLWEQTPAGEEATGPRSRLALDAVVRSEHAHFTLLWEDASRVQRLVLQALAREPGRPFRAEYRSRHELPPATNVQKALTALEQREVVAGEGGEYRIVEPFLAEWLSPTG